MDGSFSDTQSKNLLRAARRLLPSSIVLNTREQTLEALELALERAKIYGRVYMNAWQGPDNFRIDVTGLELPDFERLQRAADTGAFDDARSGGAEGGPTGSGRGGAATGGGGGAGGAS